MILRGIGFSIESTSEEQVCNLTAYIIRVKDIGEELKYHAGDGNMTDMIWEAEFYPTETFARHELTKFDEPDDYMIKRVAINIRE